MARKQTAAAERTEQNHRLVDEVEAETGVPMTVRRAQDHRRNQANGSNIQAREIDFADTELVPIGVVLAKVDSYRITKATTATLGLVTNAREFGSILHEAGLLSSSDLLAVALYAVPRNLGLDDDEDAGSEWDD